MTWINEGRECIFFYLNSNWVVGTLHLETGSELVIFDDWVGSEFELQYSKGSSGKWTTLPREFDEPYYKFSSEDQAIDEHAYWFRAHFTESNGQFVILGRVEILQPARANGAKPAKGLICKITHNPQDHDEMIMPFIIKQGKKEGSADMHFKYRIEGDNTTIISLSSAVDGPNKRVIILQDRNAGQHEQHGPHIEKPDQHLYKCVHEGGHGMGLGQSGGGEFIIIDTEPEDGS